ncbi:hypothetical protein [Sphingomicrobium lutaoense]|uniref:Uncharacterized protein n=1 Tax=Sphingomicrobium lutaoense TaxID=515949 RepID=A0A839Z7F4_9SPHN|nr:hypothetical protein [Sphingomicrobium lutaoense]MBB3764764.1 hypothetical protein [Sphingomicrobium lutaoense]
MNDRSNLKARIALTFFLLLAGAALATWGLSRWEGAARFFGIAEAPRPVPALRVEREPDVDRADPRPAARDGATRAAPPAAEEVAELEARIARLERSLEQAEGSAGRADALLVAFAARRAIERGVALGYLEPLLVARFGEQHEAAVATIITGARNPVALEQLIERYQALGPALRRGDPDESVWASVKREFSNLVAVYPANQPNPRPQARYERALVQLRLGDVDAALTETLRLPGIDAAKDWIEDARAYIATRRALDRIESAALLSRGENRTN